MGSLRVKKNRGEKNESKEWKEIKRLKREKKIWEEKSFKKKL